MWLSWLEHHATHQKIVVLILGRGTYRRQPDDISLPLSLSLSLSLSFSFSLSPQPLNLSLKSIKHILGGGLTKSKVISLPNSSQRKK